MGLFDKVSLKITMFGVVSKLSQDLYVTVPLSVILSLINGVSLP